MSSCQGWMSLFSYSETPWQPCFTFLVCHPVLGLHSLWFSVTCRGPGPGRLGPGHRYLSETILQALEWGATDWNSYENATFVVSDSQSSVSVNPRDLACILCPGQLGPGEEAQSTGPVMAVQLRPGPKYVSVQALSGPAQAGPTCLGRLLGSQVSGL